MRFGYNDTCLEHDTGPRHPESPDRLRAIKRRLVDKHGVEYFDAAPAPMEALTAVHDEEYVTAIREFCETGGGNWDPDTVAVKATWQAARQSAGLAIQTAQDAVAGASEGSTPFSLGRPPGHHAVSDDAMGFCFLNNTAVAARRVIEEDTVNRVAIFDWDVHHGNGTQEIFYEDGDVYYASIHEEGLYPGTGDVMDTGAGAGEGTTLNLPLPAGAGDPEYELAMDDLIIPGLSRFDPDLLLVSAGFDAHEHDPISRMRLSTEAYGVIADRLQTFATPDLPLGLILEGGYSLDMLADGIGIVHDVFHGYTPIEPTGSVADHVRSRIERARDIHGLG